MSKLFSFFSKRSDPTSESELNKPWRSMTWSEEEKRNILKQLKEFQISTSNVSDLKILLHGPIGAGKSSFINSVNTALQGRIIVGALVDSNIGESQSFTLKLKYHQMKKDEPGCFYPFVLTDIMGLEPGQSKGVQTDDIVSVLHGHVRNGYIFNPASPLAKGNEFYISYPELDNKVHCLVSVLPADKISLIDEDVIQKMKHVREKARDLGVPQVIIMPMVDKACPLVKENLEKIYTSKKIKEKMQECSIRLGVPLNCIFPVKNYHEEMNNDMHVDILILMAIKNIIFFASDYVEDQDYTYCASKSETSDTMQT